MSGHVRDDEGRDRVEAEPSSSEAPGLLSSRADAAPLPPPIRDAEEVTSLHLGWARLTAGQGAPADAGASDVGGVGGVASVRAKVRARVAAAARPEAAADRALIGDLIRAVDAVAARVDEVAARVGNVELLLQEVLDRLSEDLVRVQASLGALGGRSVGPERTEPLEGQTS
jgi:hypothetical protein